MFLGIFRPAKINKLVFESVKMATSRAITTVLVDLSGTIHIEDGEIPNAMASLERFVISLLLLIRTCIVKIFMTI